MCKSSSLAFVLLFAFLFRLETPSIILILIIASMTVGVILMVAGETAFNALGFVLVISAAFFSGFRWALTQILLLRNPATSNPFSSIFFLAPVMFISLLAIAIPVEKPSALLEGLHHLASEKGNFAAFLIILFPGIIAFLMTSSEFALLQRTSVVTLSICGIFKEVVTITAANVIFGDKLTPINVSGLLITIVSIAAYNYIKIKKMRADARQDAHHAGAEGEALGRYAAVTATEDGSAETDGLLSSSMISELREDVNAATMSMSGSQTLSQFTDQDQDQDQDRFQDQDSSTTPALAEQETITPIADHPRTSLSKP
jgi:solute carrier family 35 protein C2